MRAMRKTAGLKGPAPYGIRAIPTVYQHRQYRSRLEAKWAAYFDALGLAHEYEPFDLGTWSPDFMLDGTLLVEVKPISDFDPDVGAKMQAAVEATGRDVFGVLLVGTSPVEEDDRVAIGWHGFTSVSGKWKWCRAYVGWGQDADEPILRPGVFMQECPPHPLMLSLLSNGPMSGDEDLVCRYSRRLMAKWATATNAVQWKPPA